MIHYICMYCIYTTDHSDLWFELMVVKVPGLISRVKATPLMLIKINLARYRRNLQNCCPESAVWIQWHNGPKVEGWRQKCNSRTLHFLASRVRGAMACCSGSKTKRSSHAMCSPCVMSWSKSATHCLFIWIQTNILHSLCSLSKNVGTVPILKTVLCCSSKSRFALNISINLPRCSPMAVETSLFY